MDASHCVHVLRQQQATTEGEAARQNADATGDEAADLCHRHQGLDLDCAHVERSAEGKRGEHRQRDAEGNPHLQYMETTGVGDDEEMERTNK